MSAHHLSYVIFNECLSFEKCTELSRHTHNTGTINHSHAWISDPSEKESNHKRVPAAGQVDARPVSVVGGA